MATLLVQGRPSSLSFLPKPTPRRAFPATPSVSINTKLPCTLDQDFDEIPAPNYTPDDIARVQRVLLNFVPAELADAILDLAEYWPYIGASRNDFSTAYSALEGPDQNAQWCYMVRFFVKAYESSWGKPVEATGASEVKAAAITSTWFEASILKKGEIPETAEYKDNVRPNDWFSNLSSHPKYLHELRKEDCSESNPQAENPFDSKKRWHLTNNPEVSDRKWQETIWKHDDTKCVVGVDPTTGQGSGSGFLNSLAVDDRIVLMSRAMALGLTNTIFNVKLEVYYSLASSYL